MDMQPEDTQTQYRDYKLPKRSNYLSEDVERLREALWKIDQDHHALSEALRKERLQRMLDL